MYVQTESSPWFSGAANDAINYGISTDTTLVILLFRLPNGLRIRIYIERLFLSLCSLKNTGVRAGHIRYLRYVPAAAPYTGKRRGERRHDRPAEQNKAQNDYVA